MTAAGDRSNYADGTAAVAVRPGPVGLGGWLILPAIGLVTSPLRIVQMLFAYFGPIFQEDVWEALTTPGSPVYHPLLAPLIILEIAVNIAFLILSVVLIYLFFTKSWRFPRLMIAFLAADAVFMVGDWLLVGLILPDSGGMNDPESISDVARSVFTAMLWIPYFLVSRRVENTFVKPGVDKATVEAFD